MDRRGQEAHEMGRSSGLPSWLGNLEFWWLFGWLGLAACGALLQNTGNEPGNVDPQYKAIWGVGGAVCLALTQGIRTLEKKHVLRQLGAAGEAEADD